MSRLVGCSTSLSMRWHSISYPRQIGPGSIFQPASQYWHRIWHTRWLSPCWKKNRNIDTVSIIPVRLALDIICQTAMGVCVEAQSNPENQFLKDVGRISEILFCRGVSAGKSGQRSKVWQRMDSFTFATYSRPIESKSKSPGKYSDI